MAAKSPEPRAEILQTVDRTLSMMLLFQPDQPEWSLTEIAQKLGVSKSMAGRMLQTLISRGFAAQDPVTRRFHLGLRVLDLVRATQAAYSLHRTATPVMRRLVAETGETVFLTVRDRDEAVTLERLEGEHLLEFTLEVGRRTPLHAGATGKLLLAYLPEQEREAYITRTHQRFTERTIVSPDQLRAEMERIRQQGYALSQGELTTGVYAISAPISGPSGQLLGSLTIGGPHIQGTLDCVPMLVTKIQTAAREVARHL